MKWVYNPSYGGVVGRIEGDDCRLWTFPYDFVVVGNPEENRELPASVALTLNMMWEEVDEMQKQLNQRAMDLARMVKTTTDLAPTLMQVQDMMNTARKLAGLDLEQVTEDAQSNVEGGQSEL